ncbi:MAG TPA: helix-turn-helix domain-containing protein [Rhodocyclaceae bacterium]|nr:helix-turn-helix domain-containing protein [Rhodocyclaceae bacterium]
MKTVAILMPERFFTSGVTGILDVLNIANRLLAKESAAVFSWRLHSETGAPTTSSTGLVLPANGSYDQAAGADVIIVPGILYDDVPSFEKLLAAHTALTSRLRTWHADGRLIAANCTGVAFAAESGILDDQTATISWWLATWFQCRYPKVKLQVHALLVESGNLMCSGATTSYLNLALRLIERFAGGDIALRCAQLMLVDMHRASQAPYTTLQQYTGHNDPMIARCQEWLQQRLAEPFSLEALSAAVGTSERTLMRRFRMALSDTPLHYLQQMRLFTARRLLESSALSLEQIVAKVGYEDVSSFRRLFKREVQCSPGEYRQRFASGNR